MAGVAWAVRIATLTAPHTDWCRQPCFLLRVLTRMSEDSAQSHEADLFAAEAFLRSLAFQDATDRGVDYDTFVIVEGRTVPRLARRAYDPASVQQPPPVSGPANSAGSDTSPEPSTLRALLAVGVLVGLYLFRR